MIRFKVATTKVSLEEIAKIYRDEIWKIHRVPQKILNNWELQFASQFIEDLLEALGTKRTLLMAYYLQTDGQIERINQEVEVFLWYYVNYQQDNWTDWLAAVEFQYNNRKHVAIEHTLFELSFGKHSWKGNLTVQMEFPKLEEFLIRL